jgi:hypothetical protein
MKKHTVPNEPDEMPLQPDRPEITKPTDPKEPDISKREIEEIPEELPPAPGQKEAGDK